jgi:hypothetical protein
VNGAPYLTKQGGRLRLDAPAQDSAATGVSFRVR